MISPTSSWSVVNFLCPGRPDEVETKVLEAARGSILELVRLTEAESERTLALNPAHIVAVSGTTPSERPCDA